MTAELAELVGLHSRTLQRYRRLGWITPETESAGGHARWDVENVKAELKAIRSRIAAERAENDKAPE